MIIAETYSHLNGLEFLLVHRPKLWEEIQDAIKAVDANRCRTKVSKERTKQDKHLYSPIAMNQAFKRASKNSSSGSWADGLSCAA